MWKWNDTKETCENLAEPRNTPSGDDCSHASLYSNSPLKGQNCKAAMQTIEGIKARSSALNDSSQALANGYATMQTMQATGQQGDAQTRQQNIMKMLAVTKMVTGGAQLEGAMELKNAASGAENAQSAITGAQKSLSEICAKAADEQTCFYQNAPKVGIDANAASYANYAHLRRAAAQSQEQADTANKLAKSSMITGLADTLVGIQAWKMAQQAQQNAAGMATMPGVAPPPRPPSYNFGGGASVSNPGVAQSAPTPTDYGTPSDGLTMGDQANAPIRGTLAAGRMGAPNTFKPASSGVTGGGGGGAGGGGFSGIKGGKDGPRKQGKKGPSDVGSYSMGGGTGFKGGGGGPEKGPEGTNPLAEMLAKMFPQDKDGKPVVDARALASQTGGEPTDQGQGGEESVSAAEATIFEQVSAKYHQLNFSGRI